MLARSKMLIFVLLIASMLIHSTAFSLQALPLTTPKAADSFVRQASRSVRFAGRSSTVVCSADPAATIRDCAITRSADGAAVVAALEAVEANGEQIGRIPTEQLAGSFDLVFSSAIANVPLINGYMPTKEVITWDIEQAKMTLDIEILPFLPHVMVEGANMKWDEQTSKVAYTIKNKDGPSEWTFFYADDNVLAGRSSVTGLNVLRRL